MRKTYFIQISLIIIFSALLFSCAKQEDTPVIEEPTYEIIEMNTDFGLIYIWLYNETPLHKKNFIRLADQQFYDSLIFHRVIKNFVIQGGDPTGTGNGGPNYTIPAEFDTGIVHDYGAVGAARLGNKVNPEKESNGSQFYIVQDKDGEHHLDMEYTVFGTVIQGMNVVDSIASVKVGAAYRPVEDVRMLKVKVLHLTAEEILQRFALQVEEL